MNDLLGAPASSQVHHYHWLAFWKPMAVIALLVVLGVGGILVWLPPGLGLLALALIGAVSLYLHWSWHTFTFTPDNRLILRRGVNGSTKDVISLFGVVVSYQIPLLGPWLDVGSVYLSPLGRNIHIRHIAHFEAFYSRLVYGAQQQASRAEPPVQVIVQFLPAPRAEGGWLGPLPPAEAGSELDYFGSAIQWEPDTLRGDQ